MATKAQGRILFWEGASLWILRAPPGEQYPRTDLHAHHAIQLTLALTGEVEIDSEVGRLSGLALSVAPDAPHAFRGTGCVAHLFVDPDGQAGRKLVRSLASAGPVAPLPSTLLGEIPARLRANFEDPSRRDEHLRAIATELIAHLSGEAVREEHLDPRIAKVIALLGARLDEPLTLADIAEVAGLSEGRTRHLFVENTGLSFKTYVLWLRLTRAVEMFAAGATLTDAAHGAGFSDSAHLSRTFRRMFGIAAVSLQLS